MILYVKVEVSPAILGCEERAVELVESVMSVFIHVSSGHQPSLTGPLLQHERPATASRGSAHME